MICDKVHRRKSRASKLVGNCNPQNTDEQASRQESATDLVSECVVLKGLALVGAASESFANHVM